jgi:GT2 family glycosyltransferase
MSIGLSIVIPTYARRDLVEALLVSVSEDAKRADFEVEVIIVDDSPPAEARTIRSIAAAHGAKVYDSPTPNVGGKRNIGLQRASHDLVLFLDSDVTIRAGTLEAHVRRLSSCGDEVAGCLGKVEFVGEETYAWRVIEAMQLTLPFSYPDVADRVPWGPTANLSFRRAPFLELGGFDTTLPRYGGEDVDLGLRLADRGWQIVTAPDAVAEHAIETWSTWRQNLRRLWSFGLADYHLLVRHPSRSFLDFPTGPMLWAAQLGILCVLVAMGAAEPITAACALVASIAAYPLVYALLKRRAGTSLRVHLLGPVIFWIMDTAKAWEAARRGRLSLVFRRLRFLDDLIAQDWHEVAASAWALSASGVVFVGVLVLQRITQ